jgi:hypothetical protein
MLLEAAEKSYTYSNKCFSILEAELREWERGIMSTFNDLSPSAV